MSVNAAVLPKLHTRQLLRALRMTRARGSLIACIVEGVTCEPYPDQDDVQTDDTTTIVDADLIGGVWRELSEVTIADVKAELAKRPHIMNKPEGSAARREKHRQGRQRGRSDR